MKDAIEQLEHMNYTLERMLDVMKAPENKFVRLMNIVGTGVSIAGIISLIDIIRKWIGG